jgi:hypothetical protein
MPEQQIWALIVFSAIVMALVIALPTGRPRLDGRQKYRSRARSLLGEDGRMRASMSPIGIALASLSGGGSSSDSGSDGSSDVDFDASDSDGGGDGGGD